MYRNLNFLLNFGWILAIENLKKHLISTLFIYYLFLVIYSQNFRKKLRLIHCFWHLVWKSNFFIFQSSLSLGLCISINPFFRTPISWTLSPMTLIMLNVNKSMMLKHYNQFKLILIVLFLEPNKHLLWLCIQI
jgi:hypothetical protein